MTGARTTTTVTRWCRAARVNAACVTETSTTRFRTVVTPRLGSVSNVSTTRRDTAANAADLATLETPQPSHVEVIHAAVQCR